MNKAIAIASAAVLSLSLAPAASAVQAAPTAVSAQSSDYSAKKKNRFWRVVKSYDPLVKYAGKKSTVGLGVATCDLLRAGGTLYDLSLLVYEADAGYAEDSLIAVMAAAPVVLCPDQQYKFE